jgi:selenocysteine lyase/cysteine desulfurase
MNWNAIRTQFPALKNWTYLNTATFGQVSTRAYDAVARHFAHRNELASADFLSWFDEMDGVRASVARLINCQPTDIAFINNASSGLAILLRGLDWKPGDQVVTLEDEFPNQLYALSDLQSKGVEYLAVPWERFVESITERTRVVALSSANYNTGFVPPLEEIADLLRQRGVLFYVDGTQSLGALQFDIAKAQPDVFAVDGYKWLLCPNGAGFVYIRPELREKLHPTTIGWRSHHDWHAVDNLHHGAPVFSPDAEKYEGGMLSFALLYAMQASIEMMLEIGPAQIEERVLGLADQIRQVLRNAGAQVAEHRSPIVTARFEHADPSKLTKALRERRVIVAARKGQLRVSPHFYNNAEDIGTFARELRAAT